MQIPAIAQQIIDINSNLAQTQQAIATAVAVKQQNVAKQQGQALVDLITQAPTSQSPSRGIDIKA